MENSPNTDKVKGIQTHVNLPMKPEEPLASDCCGSGCTPCVFDIYEEDLRKWEQSCKDLTRSSINKMVQCLTISRSEFKVFELETMKKVTENCWLYRFAIPGGGKLGLKTGEHLILRLL
jgi:cytochrome-b5 reductase